MPGEGEGREAAAACRGSGGFFHTEALAAVEAEEGMHSRWARRRRRGWRRRPRGWRRLVHREYIHPGCERVHRADHDRHRVVTDVDCGSGGRRGGRARLVVSPRA